MKKTQVSVSDDLEEFCPLTTWRRRKMYWDQIMPFLLVAIAVSALFGGVVSVIHSLYHVAFLAGFVAFCAIIFCLPAFTSKVPLAYVREQIRLRNKDGYWMRYTIRKDGSGEVGNTILTSHIEEWEGKHRFTQGFHVLLPFDGKRRGRIFFGENVEEANPNSDKINAQLKQWSLEPVLLTKARARSLPVCLIDSVGKSMELPLREAIEFLSRAPIGWLDDNTLAVAFASHRMNRERLRRESATLETNLDRALKVSAKVASDLHSDGRYFLSPSDMMIVRQPSVQLLDDLLTPDDPRRAWWNFPPPTHPDAELAASNPLLPDSTPSVSGDD